MKVHAYASWPHYVDHIAPIWNALHPSVKGQFVVSSTPLLDKLNSKNIEGVLSRHKGKVATALNNREPILVAGYSDLKKQRRRPIAFLEHGAGQTYVLDDGTIHGGYSGGKGRSSASLFLCPNDNVAKRNLRSYPDAKAVVVGCPRLDDLLQVKQEAPEKQGLTVAISFHWDCILAKETGSAFKYFNKQILDFVKWCHVCGIDVIGHGHPKAWTTLKGWWEDNGIRPVKEWEEVVGCSDVLVIDNSSIMYEAASLGMKVIVLESPEWRKNVNHGLRFWDLADVGPTVTPQGSLVNALNETQEQKWEDKRAEIAAQVYSIAPSLGRLSSGKAASALWAWAKTQE